MLWESHAASVQERTYVVGPHGGKLNSVKVDSFTGDAHALTMLPLHAKAALAIQCTFQERHVKALLELSCAGI